MAIESLANPVLYGQLFEQQKEKIEAQVRAYIVQASSALDAYFEFKPSIKGASSYSYRKLIAPKVLLTDLKPLQENVAPEPESLGYGEYTAGVKDYAASMEYTDKDVHYGFDNIIADADKVIGNKLGYYKLLLELNALFASRGTFTPEAKLIATLDKAKTALVKSHAKPFPDGTFHCWLTIELLNALQAEIAANGQALSEGLRTKLDNGSQFTYHGWSLFTDYTVTQYLYNGAKSRIVFLGLDMYGRKPAVYYGTGVPEIYHDPLGQAGPLTTENGKLVGDHARQKGAVSGKLVANGAMVQNDPTVLVCDYDTAAVVNAPLDVHSYESYSGFRSSSSSPSPIRITSDGGNSVAARASLQLKSNVGSAVAAIWASDDTNKATVDANGKVTGVAAGTANITVTYGGITSEPFAVTVTAAGKGA